MQPRGALPCHSGEEAVGRVQALTVVAALDPIDDALLGLRTRVVVYRVNALNLLRLEKLSIGAWSQAFALLLMDIVMLSSAASAR